MNQQPDHEKQAAQAPATTPLKVRTDLRAGAREGYYDKGDGIRLGTDPSYTSVGVSGSAPFVMFDPTFLP